MKKTILKAANGQIKANLVIKNINIVDVFNHKICKGNVGIKDGIFIGIGDYCGEKEIDGTDKFLMPTFADSHVHIESSMISPSEYAKTIVPTGVTTFIADPHEIVNVCGENGLKYMSSFASEFYDLVLMMPSCVPATPFDSGGCVIDSKQTKRLLKKYCYGLGEMMNYPGVIFGENEIINKLSDKYICDGHAPLISGKHLNTYVCAGISTDHECDCAQEAEEKITNGMYIHIREGTGAKNLEELIKAVTPYNLSRFTFCTDDKHIDDIFKTGTISNCVNKAIDLGLDPISAITIATINARKCYGIKNSGAIAPGYIADFIITKDLSAKNIERVYKSGILVGENGEACFEISNVANVNITNTVHTPILTEESFKATKDTIIEFYKGSLITKIAKSYTDEELTLCSVIERHNGSGRVGSAYIKNLNISGAIAQSIGHDSHNITVAGSNTKDMLVAVTALGSQGGIAVARDGKIISHLPLPIGGLMSDKKASEVLEKYNDIIKSTHTGSEILMLLSFVSLLVIPHIKLSDKGLFDVDKFKFIGNKETKKGFHTDHK